MRITSLAVIAKVERLMALTGSSETAVIDKALDCLLHELVTAPDQRARMAALLAQLDRVPDRARSSDPLEWDANGLPL